jgi:predicted nucleic acid-binding protein
VRDTPHSHAHGPAAGQDANVVDSSAWLEYFAGGPNARAFAPAVQAIHQLVVPSITLYEVYRRMDVQRGRGFAQQAVAQMMQGRVVDLDAQLALRAAQLSRVEGLPMADSIVLATARLHLAALWTQDDDFEDIPGVHFFRKAVST